MTRVLILTADAGFGHRSAANAVAAALQLRYGDACQVSIVNALEDRRTPAWLRRTQSDYDRMIREMPELYEFGYRASDGAFTVGLVEQALILVLYPAIRDILAANRPDVIVTTYPLYSAPLAANFALSGEYVPVITVVTDLANVHGMWFNDEVDLTLVPTDIVRERALASGLLSDRVEVTGLPVNPELAQSDDKPARRRRLGWGRERFMALVAAGKRVAGAEPAVDALNHSGLPLELALVTGGDEALFERWRAEEWHLPAHVYGFVDNMPELMLAADLIVCKAGGLIVSEALAAGLPALLVEALPGQEVGNAQYVVDGGAGELAEGPIEVLRCACHWLERDGDLLAQRAARARRLGHPEAALRVAELAMKAAAEGARPRDHRLLAQVPRLRELLSSARSRP